MINQIVSKCHVSNSNMQVIRYVIGRMKQGYKTYKTLDKRTRKQILKDCIMCHTQNKKLYASI